MSEERNLPVLFKSTNSDLPTFAQEDGLTGMENLRNFIVPPRVKVIQPLSDSSLKERFSEGDTILVPAKILISEIIKNENGKSTKNGLPWEFVPIFFFAEFIAWNPRKMKGTLPAIRNRSVDPDSELAAKCRNRETWFEECPENKDMAIRNQEHLNFIIVPISGISAGTPCLLSFTRSEHKAGTAFASLVDMRKAPLFACVFQAQVGFRENSEGEWYGIDVTNPDENGGWVRDEVAYNSFKEHHKNMRAAHDTQILCPDYGDDEVEEPASTEY